MFGSELWIRDKTFQIRNTVSESDLIGRDVELGSVVDLDPDPDP
jgi:hypothetical protein